MPRTDVIPTPAFEKGKPILASRLEMLADAARQITLQPGQFQNGRLRLTHAQAGSSEVAPTLSRSTYAFIVKNIPPATHEYDEGTGEATATPGQVNGGAVILVWNEGRTAMITEMIGASPSEPRIKTALWRGDQTFWASADEPVWVKGSIVPFDDGASSGASASGEMGTAFMIDSEVDLRMLYAHDRTLPMSIGKDADGKPEWQEDLLCPEES